MAEEEENTLFTKLKKLFSTDVIVRNVGGKKLKIVDTDEIQYATDRNSLRDRYNRLRSSTYNLHNRDMSLSYQSARLELFRDYDVMDMDPILGSALDIYSDECLSAETIIPLLDGRKTTIKDLYDKKEKDFWVYSVDRNGNFIPQKCERVAHNGKKKMVKLTLCDGTEVKCTQNHIWVLENGEQVKTSDLIAGSSLMAFSTKISNSKYLNGYEMIKEKGNWKYTHRLVANTHGKLKEEKENLKSSSKVIHHASFDKRNNSPELLAWMDSKKHYQLHAQRNKEIWSDATAVVGYKKKIKDAIKAYWTPEKRSAVSARQRAFMKNFTNKLSTEERKVIFGLPGERNGMFGKGYKLAGKSNGRWKNFSQEVDVNEYEKDILSGITDKELAKKYNISRHLQSEIEEHLRKKWNVDQVKQISPKARYLEYLEKGVTPEAVKSACEELLLCGVNIFRKNSAVAERFSMSAGQLRDFLSLSKYNNIRDLLASNNHRVIDIEDCGELDAYDLVNVGETHVYAIEAKDGSKVFTHNCLVPNEFGRILQIRSSDDNIKQILENLFYDILNVEFNLWSWTRNLCKYGDFFLKLELSPEYGVYVARPLSAYEVTRVEGTDPTNINYVKFQHDGLGGGSTYESFEIAHFRLISDSNFMPYGKSMIEPARRVWKQLSLMEDAMLIHRIMRAPEKRMFYIDVGNIPPSEIDGYVQKMINNTKKVPYIDEKTGDYNLRFNLNNMVEDFYLPVRGSDSGTRIDTLPGMDFTGIEDLEYVRNKMMAALKIPKAFLGYEEGLSGKATLAAEDVRFSRTIGRLQRIIVSELTKIAIVHLYIQGYQDASLVDFELELNNPSTIFEQEKLAIWQDKLNVAKDMMDSKLFSKNWIYHYVWDMTENEIKDVEDEVVEDQKQTWRLEQINSEGTDPAAKFGGPDEGDAGGEEEEEEAGAVNDGDDDLPALEEALEAQILEDDVSEDDVTLDEKKERDQTGNKEKYSSTWTKTRGEDPLGRLENRAKSRTHPLKHKFKGGSPLAMSEGELKKMFEKIQGVKRPELMSKKKIIAEVEEVLKESAMIDKDNNANN